MEAITCLMTRRSVRSYQDRQVDEQALQTILEAGTYAPSAKNFQAAKIVVIQDPEVIRDISGMNAKVLGKAIDPFFGAPTVIVVFSNTQRRTFVEDGTLVLGNIMLAAHALGLSTCWVHRAREVFESPEGKAYMKQWGLGEEYVGIGNCALGYASAPLPAAKPRKKDYIIRI